MKIGFFAVGVGATVEPQAVRAVAMAAERLGFASLWAPEHVVLVEQYASKYPYSSGQFPGRTDIPIADPFTTLAYAAACTSTIRLGTGICLVPEQLAHRVVDEAMTGVGQPDRDGPARYRRG